MPMFVHIASASRALLIRRTGIRPRRGSGVFAMPVTRNFHISHQWVRELKRWGRGRMVGIYFRISDDQTVSVGHYGQAHREMTAAQAVAQFLAAGDRWGWEVIIPRRIMPAEIHRVRRLPQLVGWRFFPGAKGRPPRCTCKYCTRGSMGLPGSGHG